MAQNENKAHRTPSWHWWLPIASIPVGALISLAGFAIAVATGKDAPAWEPLFTVPLIFGGIAVSLAGIIWVVIRLVRFAKRN